MHTRDKQVKKNEPLAAHPEAVKELTEKDLESPT
jgi:hypothetical protein